MHVLKRSLMLGAVLAGILSLGAFAGTLPGNTGPRGASADKGTPGASFLPDLRVESAVSRWDGYRLQYYLEITVRNASSAVGTTQTFNVGATAASGRWSASTYIAGLGAGQSKVVRLYRGGTCGFDGTVWVDIPSVVGESNEGNNSRPVWIVC